MTTYYDRKKFYRLLRTGFSIEELKSFCLLNDQFRPIYEQIHGETRKDIIVRKLVEYCERKSIYHIVLDWAKENNPAQYEAYQSYVYISEKEKEKKQEVIAQYDKKLPQELPSKKQEQDNKLNQEVADENFQTSIQSLENVKEYLMEENLDLEQAVQFLLKQFDLRAARQDASPPQEDSGMRYYLKGIEHMLDMQFGIAMSCFQKAQFRKNSEAASKIEQAQKGRDEFIPIYKNALNLIIQKKYEKAIEELDKGLNIAKEIKVEFTYLSDLRESTLHTLEKERKASINSELEKIAPTIEKLTEARENLIIIQQKLHNYMENEKSPIEEKNIKRGLLRIDKTLNVFNIQSTSQRQNKLLLAFTILGGIITLMVFLFGEGTFYQEIIKPRFTQQIVIDRIVIRMDGRELDPNETHSVSNNEEVWLEIATFGNNNPISGNIGLKCNWSIHPASSMEVREANKMLLTSQNCKVPYNPVLLKENPIQLVSVHVQAVEEAEKKVISGEHVEVRLNITN